MLHSILAEPGLEARVSTVFTLSANVVYGPSGKSGAEQVEHKVPSRNLLPAPSRLGSALLTPSAARSVGHDQLIRPISFEAGTRLTFSLQACSTVNAQLIFIYRINHRHFKSES